jgi:hypothetical protein
MELAAVSAGAPEGGQHRSIRTSYNPSDPIGVIDAEQVALLFISRGRSATVPSSRVRGAIKCSETNVPSRRKT